MIQMGRVMIGLGLVVVATGCFEHTYTLGAGAPTGPVVYDEWQNHWLSGLIGEKNLDLGVLCPSGNATIHDEQSFLNGLVAVLTVGIYSPTTVKIRCDGGRSAEINLPGEQVMTILRSPAFMQRMQELLPGQLEEARLGVQVLEEQLQD